MRLPSPHIPHRLVDRLLAQLHEISREQIEQAEASQRLLAALTARLTQPTGGGS